MPTTNIKLGYGGGAFIGSAPVLITSGNLQKSRTVPRVEPFSTPNTSSSRAAVPIGAGVWTYTGSISFDWTIDAVASLITTTFLERNKTFDVIISDGNKQYKASDCKFSSISISASAGQLVTGSIDFQTCTDFTDDTTSLTYMFDQNTHMLVKYWQSGNSGVETFTLNISQPLTAGVLNWANGTDDERETAQYLRAGLWDISLEVSAFTDWLSLQQVNVGNKVLRLTHGLYESKGFSFNGVNDTGSHNYTFRANALANSGASFFTIT